MALPSLVVVSGPAGSGKTTLAHELARAIGCPAICRDEIKEGMVHAARESDPSASDALNLRTLRVFFEVVQVLLEGGVTVVAEAAFQDKVWAPHLQSLAAIARLRVVQCHVDPETARRRMRDRASSRRAHADFSVIGDARYFEEFVRLSVDAPSIKVDTSSGYAPSISELVAFVNTST